MKNSDKVNLYVYTIVEADGSEIYSYPFAAVDNESAIYLVAHTLATYKFHCKSEYNVGHLYCIGSLVYSSSYFVPKSCIDDLSYFYVKDEVHFDPSLFHSSFDDIYSKLSSIASNSEEKANA